jgi:hypothetical protein
MISIITYCRHPMPQSLQERNVGKTINAPYEYLVIDGSKEPLRFSAAYNWAKDHVKGDIVVFIYDELYFMSMNWGGALEFKFSQDSSLAMIGIAGSQYLFADKYSLTAAGRPFIKGKIMFHLQNGDFFAALFSQEKGDCEVVALDGSFLAVRTEVLKKTMFDEALFGGSHFWDMDFCMQARKQGKIIVTSDIVAKRMSQQVFDPEWYAAGRQFLQKYKNELPASCVSQIPDPAKALPVQMVNIKGKVPMETIC